MQRGLGSVAGRVCVVTGAASGIGRATAHLLKRRGARLVLADRNAQGLGRVVAELGGDGAVLAERVDVTRVEQVEHFARSVEQRFGAAELVVNAAGVLVLGRFLDTTAEDWEIVLAVNLLGPAHVCRALLPAMIERGKGGHVVNVASAAAFATQSELSAYGASKHALLGLSQALHDELAPAGIGVSLVCPGFVDTPILEHARVRGDDPEASRRAAGELLKRRRLSAERVAEHIVRAAERGLAVSPVGVEARALFWLSRLAPGSVSRVFAAVRRLGSRT